MKILMNPGAYHSRFISKRTESLLCRTVLTEAQVLSELAGHRRVTRSLRAGRSSQCYRFSRKHRFSQSWQVIAELHVLSGLPVPEPVSYPFQRYVPWLRIDS